MTRYPGPCPNFYIVARKSSSLGFRYKPHHVLVDCRADNISFIIDQEEHNSILAGRDPAPDSSDVPVRSGVRREPAPHQTARRARRQGKLLPAGTQHTKGAAVRRVSPEAGGEAALGVLGGPLVSTFFGLQDVKWGLGNVCILDLMAGEPEGGPDTEGRPKKSVHNLLPLLGISQTPINPLQVLHLWSSSSHPILRPEGAPRQQSYPLGRQGGREEGGERPELLRTGWHCPREQVAGKMEHSRNPGSL